MSKIQMAKVLAGAVPLQAGNFNEAFTGLVLMPDGVTTRGAFIKDMDAVQLVNEVMAWVLAKRVGLPIPDAYLAIVDPADLALTKAPTLANGSAIAFVSIDAKAPNVLFRINQQASAADKDKVIADLLQWADLGGLYAFDAWLANVDRNRKNLLFGGQNQVWLIDHGHCFTGPNWQIADLDPDKEYLHKLSLWLTTFMTDEQKSARLKEASDFSATVAPLNIVAASDDALLPNRMQADRRDALVSFLDNRKAHIVGHASKALGMLT